MNDTVKSFKELTFEQQALAGGKGGTLARMYQAGYPVPEGFVVLPAAFQHGKLNNESWNEILNLLNKLRKNNKGAIFAVRSSALSEDSASASFAGEFESVLNVETDGAILEAIYVVYKSRESERVKSYSSVQGMEQNHHIAVVVQLMVQSEISGVLFTADPITGSYKSMIGNYVHGLGEQLVSGDVNACDFKLIRPKGKYEGPDELKKYAARLYQYASKLEKELGKPQDIEWAAEGGNIYLLQSRPITTLSAGNPDIYEINYSLMGDELWTNTNVAEAIPDVYPPFSWSIARLLDDAINFIPGYYVFSGNICGRPYMNISKRVSAIAAVTGKNDRSALMLLGDLYGELPEGMQMPLYPFSRIGVLKVMLPIVIRIAKQSIKAKRNYSEFLKDTPDWCINMRERINNAEGKKELLDLWKSELRPYFEEALNIVAVAAIKIVKITSLDKKLTDLVGTEDTNTLLSNLRRGSGLASLGPVIGISNVINGKMRHEEYLVQYGHRGPHEYELSIPDVMEDTGWLEKQIEEFKKSNIDVEELLNKQHTKYEAARERFAEKFPNKVKWLDRQIEKTAAAAQTREQGRSEFVRVFRIIRAFALKSGELTGMGEDIFFLYIEEIERLLSGITPELKNIPARKENYERYKAMPPFPSIIRGRFNPSEWAENPDRRLDYYDAAMPPEELPDSRTLSGCAGAAGRIEGTVRILTSPEEGEKLLPGEILVAVTTNIGWTPIFPKAAAIITDIGAPLSHAAIVARELGIPAVVGCTNATARLKTGDKVLVDGGRGRVQILE